MKAINLVGKQFNQWKVIKKDANRGSEVYYLCECSCGTIKSVNARALRSGKSTSCGCLSGHPNFQIIKQEKIFEKHPELIRYVDTKYNSIESLENYTCGSRCEVGWKCDENHTYTRKIYDMIKAGGVCPICSNKRIVSGVNDFETWCKENARIDLLNEWSDKNELVPSQISSHSNQYIVWECSKCGYSWKTRLNVRSSQLSGCPNCIRRLRTSFPEQSIYYYLHSYFSDAVNGDRIILEGKELDIYIPSKLVAIEYDGENWHKDHSKDIKKDLLCEQKGIVLYRIREHLRKNIDYSSDSSISYTYQYQDWNALSGIIVNILKDLGINHCDVDITRDHVLIKESYYLQTIANSLAERYPEIAKEWHPNNNGKITPYMVSAETHDSFDWLCDKGHTFTAIVKNRVRMHSGCPYCAGQKVLQGFNDLCTTNPEQALDYDNEKNKRKSTEVSRGCSDFVWWKCHKCGYEFYYQLSTYIKANYSCPCCSDRSKTKFKKVLNYETKELFNTTIEAARSVGFSEEEARTKYKNISKACCSEFHSAYGYHWFYVLTDFNGNLIEDISKFIIDNTYIDAHYKSHVGETYNMGYGQTATIIAENRANDVTIQFNDGTIVEHCVRSRVKCGNIKNPNFVRPSVSKESKPKISYVGRANIMKNGMSANVIKDFSHKDITIEFEDGTIVEHCKRVSFDKGTIKNPNYDSSSPISAPRQKHAQINNVRATFVGRTNTMKNGLLATVIEDYSYDNITVQFDDGYVVNNCSRRAFIDGSISNPNIYLRYVNQSAIMKCGLKCTIKDINPETKTVLVKFDDDNVLVTSTLKKFLDGNILTDALSHNYRYRTLGERKQMKCGEFATIIADRGAHDIDVRFDDGTIVSHRDRVAFDKGNIKNPSTATNYVGKTARMKCGLLATVIEDNGWNDITVEFEDGVIIRHKRRSHFDTGSISHK